MTNLLKTTLVSISLLFIFNSCEEFGKDKLDAEKMRGTWVLQSVSNDGKTGHNEDEMLESAELNQIAMEGVSISFFEDMSYTDIRGNGEYNYGQWKYNDDDETLMLTGTKRRKFTVTTSSLVNEVMTMELTNVQTREKWMMVRTELPLAKYKEDQFYGKNNLWRIRPEKPETLEQLQERMANHIKHIGYILHCSTERKESHISFAYSFGPVKIYNGGVGIRDFEMASEIWKKGFFNELQAREAYSIYDNYLGGEVYKGSATGDWVKDDYTIIQSIYADFKNKQLYPAIAEIRGSK